MKPLYRPDNLQNLNLELPAADVSAPTLIVHGSEDVNVPVDLSHAIARKISGAQLVVIEGADHMMPFSHKAELAEIISRFSENITN